MKNLKNFKNHYEIIKEEDLKDEIDFITNYENQPLSNGEYWYLPVAEERYKKLVKVFDEFGRHS